MSLRINLLLLMARRMKNMFSHYFNFFISLFFLSFSESEERAELGRRIVSEQVLFFCSKRKNFSLPTHKKKVPHGTKKRRRKTDDREKNEEAKKELRKNENLIRLIYY